MVGQFCCVNNCHSSSHNCKGLKRNHGIRFFRFPTWKKQFGEQLMELTKRRRMAWVSALKRKTITFENIPASMRVCSLHFQSGRPAYEMLDTHPDWAPSLLLGHEDVKVPDRRRKHDLEERKMTEQFLKGDDKELHFCAPLSHGVMQATAGLSQEAEVTLSEQTEQQRTRQDEEKLCGLESVHMAECVSAHGGVSDIHHTHSSLIKTETDLGSPHIGHLIKTESLDSAELQCMSSLHSDHIKTESVDGGYFKVEDIIKLEDIQCVTIKSDQIKNESFECLESDVMNTVLIGAAVGLDDQTVSEQCAGEPNQNCRNDKINLLTKCEDLYHNCDSTNENTQHRIVLQKSITDRKEHIDEKCFLKRSDADRHFIIHSGEKPYKCAECGKCFPQKSTLKRHEKVHSGVKPYKCIECEKCFSEKSTLTKHKKVHSGEKPCECTLCGKCFSRKASLHKHVRVHSGEKPYRCSVCRKSFSEALSLNYHKCKHLGEKPYKCTRCGKGFLWKYSLIRHIRLHTGENP